MISRNILLVVNGDRVAGRDVNIKTKEMTIIEPVIISVNQQDGTRLNSLATLNAVLQSIAEETNEEGEIIAEPIKVFVSDVLMKYIAEDKFKLLVLGETLNMPSQQEEELWLEFAQLYSTVYNRVILLPISEAKKVTYDVRRRPTEDSKAIRDLVGSLWTEVNDVKSMFTVTQR